MTRKHQIVGYIDENGIEVPSSIRDYTPEEELAADEAERIWVAGESRRVTIAKILELEGQVTARMLREASLGEEGDGKTKLEDINQQIAVLRNQL